jgi:hypothetical protein
MAQRNFVTFEWPTEDPDGREVGGEVVPGGRPIMEGVQQAVQSAGYVVSPVGQHDSYGWYFDAASGDDVVWSMLQYSEPWLLISDAKRPLLRRMLGRPSDAALSDLCRVIHGYLSQSPLAGNVQWFTSEEFAQQKGADGAPSPSEG